MVVINTLILHMNTLMNLNWNALVCLLQNSGSEPLCYSVSNYRHCHVDSPWLLPLNTLTIKRSCPKPTDVICNLLSGKKLTFLIKCLSNLLVIINGAKSCFGKPVPYPHC